PSGRRRTAGRRETGGRTKDESTWWSSRDRIWRRAGARHPAAVRETRAAEGGGLGGGRSGRLADALEFAWFRRRRASRFCRVARGVRGPRTGLGAMLLESCARPRRLSRLSLAGPPRQLSGALLAGTNTTSGPASASRASFAGRTDGGVAKQRRTLSVRAASSAGRGSATKVGAGPTGTSGPVVHSASRSSSPPAGRRANAQAE